MDREVITAARDQILEAAGQRSDDAIGIPPVNHKPLLLGERGRTPSMVTYGSEDEVIVYDVPVKLLSYGRAAKRNDDVDSALQSFMAGELPGAASREQPGALYDVLISEYGVDGSANKIDLDDFVGNGRYAPLNLQAIRMDVAKRGSPPDVQERLENRYRHELQVRVEQGMLRRYQFGARVPAAAGAAVLEAWDIIRSGLPLERIGEHLLQQRASNHYPLLRFDGESMISRLGAADTLNERYGSELEEIGLDEVDDDTYLADILGAHDHSSVADHIERIVEASTEVSVEMPDNYLDSYRGSTEEALGLMAPPAQNAYLRFLLEYQADHARLTDHPIPFRPVPLPREELPGWMNITMPDADGPHRYLPNSQPPSQEPVETQKSTSPSESALPPQPQPTTQAEAEHTGSTGPSGHDEPKITLPDAGPLTEPDAVLQDALDTIHDIGGVRRGRAIQEPHDFLYNLFMDAEQVQEFQRDGRLMFGEYWPDTDTIEIHAVPLKLHSYNIAIDKEPRIEEAVTALGDGDLFDSEREEDRMRYHLFEDIYDVASGEDEVHAFIDELEDRDGGTPGPNPYVVFMDLARLGSPPAVRETIDTTYHTQTQLTTEHELLHKYQIERRIPIDVGEAVSHAWVIARDEDLATAAGEQALMARVSEPVYQEYAPDAPAHAQNILDAAPRDTGGQLETVLSYQAEFEGEGTGQKRPGIGIPSPTDIVGDLLDPGGIDALGGISTGSPIADFVLDSLFK